MSVTLTSVQDHNSTEVIQVLEKLARMLVGDDELVRVTALSDAGTTMLRVQVSRADVGKVIGKDGRTARALRTILSAAGQASGQRYILDIQEHAELEHAEQKSAGAKHTQSGAGRASLLGTS